MTLTPDGDDATNLNYSVDAQIGGKLAQLGGRLIDSTAKKLAGEFFQNFAQALSPPAPEESAAAEGEAEGEKKGWLKRLIS